MQQQSGSLPDILAFLERVPGLYLLLDTDFTIIAASDAYARATSTVRHAIVGRSILEVAPGALADPDPVAAAELQASLQRVVALRRPEAMPVRKFSAARPITVGGGFETRYGSPLNTPILGADGAVRWIIHSLVDITELVSLKTEKALHDGAELDHARAIEQLRAANDQLARRLDESIRQQGDRDRMQAQRFYAEKMDAIGKLTGGMAHDFNNLLGAIVGNLDLLRELSGVDAEAEELLNEATAAALRGGEIARRLLAFARRQPLQATPIDVVKVINGMAARLCEVLGDKVELVLEPGAETWPVATEPGQLETSLVHLAANARDAMPRGGRLHVATRNVQLDAEDGLPAEARPGDYAMIEIADTGSGMAPEIVGRIFEPFFTTKEPGRGNGLGLSMVFGFVKQSGGHVEVASEPGIGTTFRLFLPRLASEAARVEPPARDAVGGNETVLVVEDDATMLRVVRRQLYELGYQVFEAERATTALRLLETEKIDLLFTDIVTPGSIDGLALARTAQARWPELKILLTSGFAQPRSGQQGGSINGMRLLSKPYRRDELARALREVLAGDRPAAHLHAALPEPDQLDYSRSA